MANDIKIQLSDIYQEITPDDIKSAKNFVLRRESTARGLEHLVDGLMEDAAEKMTAIAYRHGIDPENFQITSKYNEKMFEEMGAVLDELEDEILDLTLSYSTKCTEDEEKKKLLLLWVLAIGRNNNNLRKTLENRLWVFSRDIEAMIVAMKVAGYDVKKASNVIRNSLHNVYLTPEVRNLFKDSHKYKATYIKSKGVKYGNAGSSNSEANNIDRFARVTVQMAWMQSRKMQFEDEGAAGFMCFRGSSFPCQICDDVCGIFYPIDHKMPLPVHPACCCYAVPVYERDINELMQ